MYHLMRHKCSWNSVRDLVAEVGKATCGWESVKVVETEVRLKDIEEA